jgi:hypothetical protein
VRTVFFTGLFEAGFAAFFRAFFFTAMVLHSS